MKTDRGAIALVLLAAFGLPAAAADDGFTIALHGTIQLDTVALQSSNLPAPGHISSGGSFRRIRVGVGGHLSENWSYDFTPKLEASSLNNIAINNLYVQYDGFAPVHVRIGAQSPPTNFDDATSSGDLLFLERAQPTDLDRGIGGGTGRAAVTVFAYEDNWFGALSYTGAPANTAIFSQQGVVGRFVWRAFHDGDSNFAIGADMTHVFTLPGNSARLRERPELNMQTVDLRLIDTGSLDSDGVSNFGIEAAGNRGNLYAQGGVFHYAIDRAAPVTDDPSFSGWYLQGSWLITGETKPWRSNRGGYGMPVIAHPLYGGGFGALELAARYSDLDLDYKAGAMGTTVSADGIRGGRQRIATIGLNWYPIAQVRFLLDYSRVEAKRLSVNGSSRDGAMDLVALRSQIAF